MRLFLAVPVGEQFTAQLTTELALQRLDLKARWTRPQAWHVTLQFLGEWPENHVPGLISALEKVCVYPAFYLKPGSLDGFPNLNFLRVLFLQMDDDGLCVRLAGQVREIVEVIWPRGPQDRREFRSHLTLARIRRRLTENEVNLLKNTQLGPLGPVLVEDFKLYSSELGSDGPRYSELASFPLRK
ncbi:MAG: RNA 2',3'-cyclic phosphodiesterase [Gemmatimonadales bacterium]|nr:RNA 2',3'-cyclic phosphodiesterase [Gemmatimonadales bacterium]